MDFCSFHFEVCIKCLTYNHAPFIKDALDGFVIQKTLFPYICLIVDDASTDGEPDVLRNYISEHFDLKDNAVRNEETDDYVLSFARHKTNENCFFAVYFLKYNHHGKKSKYGYFEGWYNLIKYHALCEGDDYWTDPLKLQTQVDFLEEHEEYSLCSHRYRIYNQNSDTWEDDYVKRLFDSHPDGFSFTRSDNLRTWITKTMTLMYRGDRYHLEDVSKYKYGCDEHLNYHLLSNGLGYCFPFIGAVYRKNDSGVFSTLSEKAKRIRGVLIRSELLANNLNDIDLRDNVFLLIKKFIYKYGSLSRIQKPIGICLKSYYLTEGLMACMRTAKKFFSSFIKGFFLPKSR